jgi:hypothetical protein
MKAQYTLVNAAKGLLALSAALTLFGPGSAQAQLNEKKIERDASGVYKGQGTGGTFFVSYDTNPAGNFSFAADPSDGKVRVPVKDGKLATSMTDDDLPGSGAATCQGKEQKSKVSRGGAKIAVKAAGTMYTDEGASHGPWVGASIVGDLLDRGSKWSADTTCGASQRNGVPPDHTRALVGRKLTGKG